MITKNKILIGIATYNECDNITALIKKINKINNNDFDILIVDDNSPDKTAHKVKDLQKENNNLSLIIRNGKFGLGSAHKRIFHFAKVHKYDALITMDADFSHPPNLINEFVRQNDQNTFIIGSRYANGGSTDYIGYRKYVSTIGNSIARKLLNIPSYELTTSYRLFPKIILDSLNLSQIKFDGYAFFVEILKIIHLKSFKIKEIPFHFSDRKKNVSKIPKMQIFYSALGLLQLIFITKAHYKNSKINFSLCRGCKSQALIVYKQFNKGKKINFFSTDFSCSSVINTKKKPDLYKCLDCNLIQVSSDDSLNNLEKLYSEVVDKNYINNLDNKYKTFKNVLKKIKPQINELKQVYSKIKILEIGSYYGVFLNILEENNIEAVGIEPSRHAFEYSSNNNKQTNINSNLNNFVKNYNIKKFNMITAFDVLEHVDDVDVFIDQVSRCLLNNGYFVFSTIFIDSLPAKLLGNYWPWIIPMHLSYFDEKNIELYLKKNNFSVISMSNHVHYAKVNYAITGLFNKLPSIFNFIGRLITIFVPNKISIPFNLSDTKIIIAKKLDI